jgi:hypothetical protein
MTYRFRLAAVALAVSLAGPVMAQDAPSAQTQSPEAALPDAPGKAELMRVCTACHGAEQFAYARMSPGEWDTEIAKMQDAGALMSADEQLAISAYLGKYLSNAPPPAPAADPPPTGPAAGSSPG